MTTRILIASTAGLPLTAIDCHHGARHAADWVAQTCADYAALGIETMVLELFPAEGGDGFRRDTLEQIGAMRLDMHVRPDGLREIVGMVRQRGEGKAMRVDPVRTSVRIVDAPAWLHGDRKAIRVPRGRQNVAVDAPRTDAEKRHARRQDRAQSRAAK